MDRYEIPHGDAALVMHPVTAGLKQAFCTWLKPRYILEAMRIADDAKAADLDEDDLKAIQLNVVQARQEVNAGAVFWSAEPSTAVAAALMTEAGVIKLARLMFPESMKGWTDAAVKDYLDANSGDGTPYRVAFALAWDGADPKKSTGPAPTSAGPTDTPASPTT